MTPFEEVLAKLELGTITAPSVNFDGKDINPVRYQLIGTKFQLGLASKNIIPHRGWKLKNIKAYYGLKGKTASDCLEDFMTRIFNVFMNAKPEEN